MVGNLRLNKTLALEQQILCFIFFLLSFSALTFVLGLTLSYITAYLALGATLLVNWRQGGLRILLFLGVLLLCLFLSSLFISTNQDGQSYHIPGMLLMAHGWNPWYDWSPWSVLPAQTALVGPGIDNTINFPRGAGMLSASLYLATHLFSSIHTISFLLFFLLAFVAYRVLSKCQLSRTFTIILTLLFTLNPVITCQLGSSYVDGLMANMLTLLLLFFFDYYLFSNKWALTASLMVFMILVNIKFTGLVFGAVFITGFSAITWWERKRFPAQYFFYHVLAGILAVVVFGWQPYITNTIMHLNPFYGALKLHDGKSILSGFVSQPGFNDKNRLYQLVISLFVNKYITIGGVVSHRFNVLAYNIDGRFAGFGMVFGYCLVASLLLLAFLRRKIYVLLTLVLLFSVLLTPAAWWARLTPQLWLVPLVIILGLLVTPKRNPLSIKVAKVLAIILLVNAAGTFIYTSVYQRNNSQRVISKLKALRQQTQQVKIGTVKSGATLTTKAVLQSYGFHVTVMKHPVSCPKPVKLHKFINPLVCPD